MRFRTPGILALLVALCVPAHGCGPTEGGKTPVDRETAAAGGPVTERGMEQSPASGRPDEEVIVLDGPLDTEGPGKLEFTPDLGKPDPLRGMEPEDRRDSLPESRGPVVLGGFAAARARDDVGRDVVGKTPAERAAIQAIRELGGAVNYLNKGRSDGPIRVRLGAKTADADLVQLQHIAGIQRVSLEFCRHITDAGLAHLKQLPQFREVRLSFTNIGDGGLAHPAALRRLEVLGLTKTRVTDAGLVHLKGLTRLRWLFLSSTSVTDAGLQHLAGLTALEDLRLDYTKVGDAGLARLGVLRNLKRLCLTETQVTDAGVARLRKRLPNTRIEH